jgi:tetratricopeptide (TPR) repeat protein
MGTQREHWRLNTKAAICLAVLAAVGGAAVVALGAYRDRHVPSSGLERAKAYRDAGKLVSAHRHLDRYLAYRPEDATALAVYADVLAREARDPSQFVAATRAYEKLLRLHPDEPDSQDARRRLVELYLVQSQAARASLNAGAEVALGGLRYQAAEQVARELIRRGGTGPRDHRLLAMALEGRVLPGDDRTLEQAINEYSLVLKLDPGDVFAAEHLARLYAEHKQNPARGERVLDDLLEDLPDSAEVRLARQRFFAGLRLPDRASRELDAAAKLAPESLPVLLSTARDVLRRGDSSRSRRILEKVPEAARYDPAVVLLRGHTELSDERPDEAIETWRLGLKQSGGTDPEITWWLAYTLLQRGRFEEARPLLAQYLRLAGENAPLLRFLEATRDERTGLPAKAIARLQRVIDRLDPRWQRTAYMALGRCFESLADEIRALEAYRKAIQLDPDEASPRLAVARLLASRRPDDAAEEIERGLVANPGDPGLLVAQATARLLEQVKLPPERRSWAAFDQAVARAEKSAPAAAVALLRADRAWQDGKTDEAIKVLESAVARDPQNARLAVSLSQGLARANRPDQALAALDRASDPKAVGDRLVLRIERARLLTAAGRGREARAQLGRDADRLPEAERHEAWVSLGRLLAEQGDMVAARRAFDRASALQPEDPQPRLELLEFALASGDDAVAHETVESLRRQGGESDISFRVARATELYREATVPGSLFAVRNNALKRSAALIDSVLSDAPSLPVALLLRAAIFEKQNRIDDAIAAYQRARARGTERAIGPLVALLARSRRLEDIEQVRKSVPGGLLDRLAAEELLRAGNPAEAARIAEQAERQHPEERPWQASFYEQLGRDGDAERALIRQTENRPHDPGPWLALLRLLAKHGRRSEVDATIAKAQASVETDRRDLFLARCYWAAADHHGADSAFDEATARHPQDPEIALAAATYYETTGRRAKGEAGLAEALRRSPENRPLARRFALALSARAGGGSAVWERAWAALGPDRGSAEEVADRFTRGVLLTRCPTVARRAEGIARLDALANDLPAGNPAASESRDYLARHLLANKQPDRALRVVSPVATRGLDPDAIALYARALIDAKNPDEAERQLDRLVDLVPGDPREAVLRVHVIWGRTLPKGDPEALERAYLDRADSPGGDTLGREAFAFLTKIGHDDSPAAERLARRLAERAPGASWMMAQVLARRGRRDEALQHCLATARAGEPADLLRAATIAVSCVQNADVGEPIFRSAGAVVDEALRRSPVDAIRTLKAMLSHQRRRYGEEVEIYRDLVRRNPENVVGQNNLAWALSEGLNRPAEALELIDALIRQVGRKAALIDTRGMILTRLRRYDEAIKDLEMVAASAPTGARLFHLAYAYREAGRSDAFRDALERARRLGLTSLQVDPGERDLLKTLLAP